METVLLDEKKKFYKGNMHCHSTQSDGKFSLQSLRICTKAEGTAFWPLQTMNAFMITHI